MKELLETLCDKYLINLGLFTDLYPLDREILYPVCANAFCALRIQNLTFQNSKTAFHS